jgi:hypothetical protein
MMVTGELDYIQRLSPIGQVDLHMCSLRTQHFLFIVNITTEG